METWQWIFAAKNAIRTAVMRAIKRRQSLLKRFSLASHIPEMSVR
jgi:hypothetical protein